LEIGETLDQDTNISRDGSAPNVRCRPSTGGAPSFSGWRQSSGDAAGAPAVTAADAGAGAADAGAASATGAPVSAPPTTAARSAERRLNPPFSAGADSAGAGSDAALSVVRLRLFEAAAKGLVGSTGRLLAGRHGRLVLDSFSARRDAIPRPELLV
jgi:hypothetical protein